MILRASRAQALRKRMLVLVVPTGCLVLEMSSLCHTK
jgi:hypothetical protein